MSELAENPLELGKNSEGGAGEINSQAGTTKLQVWKTLFPGIFFRLPDAAALVTSLEEQRKNQSSPANLNIFPQVGGNQEPKKTA